MSSEQIGIEEARKALGDLVAKAETGTDIVLTRRGKPVARIVPIEEPAMPTLAESIATYRSMSTVSVVTDTLGLDQRDPAGWDLSRAEVSAEAKPFAKLIADIDAFFGDDLADALAGPEAAEAETEARRIIAENLASATMRLAITAAALSVVDLVTADAQTLHTVARAAVQRAADQRFVEVVSPAARVATR